MKPPIEELVEINHMESYRKYTWIAFLRISGRVKIFIKLIMYLLNNKTLYRVAKYTWTSDIGPVIIFHNNLYDKYQNYS